MRPGACRASQSTPLLGSTRCPQAGSHFDEDDVAEAGGKRKVEFTKLPGSEDDADKAPTATDAAAAAEAPPAIKAAP